MPLRLNVTNLSARTWCRTWWRCSSIVFDCEFQALLGHCLRDPCLHINLWIPSWILGHSWNHSLLDRDSVITIHCLELCGIYALGVLYNWYCSNQLVITFYSYVNWLSLITDFGPQRLTLILFKQRDTMSLGGSSSYLFFPDFLSIYHAWHIWTSCLTCLLILLQVNTNLIVSIIQWFPDILSVFHNMNLIHFGVWIQGLILWLFVWISSTPLTLLWVTINTAIIIQLSYVHWNYIQHVW